MSTAAPAPDESDARAPSSAPVPGSAPAPSGEADARKHDELGALAGGIAHDFNNLLASMLANVSIARAPGTPPALASDALRDIERAIKRASNLTRQLLAYSGRGQFVVVAVDLNRTLSELARLLAPTVSHRVQLRCELADELPAIEADASQIQQVVMNLVTNATEALTDHGGEIVASTRVESLDAARIASEFSGQLLTPGPHVVLEVRDNGSGIAPHVRRRMFDPFFTTKGPGRGLGLSALHGILRSHRAGVHVDTEVGRGTRVVVAFPASSSVAQPPSTLIEAMPAGRLNGTILLVDDEAMIRASSGRLLRALGLRVVAAEDGEEALALVAASPGTFDYVLLDITMPGIGGRETLRRLREIDAALPIVVSSGYSEQQIEDLDPTEREVVFLQKPYRSAELAAALERAKGAR